MTEYVIMPNGDGVKIKTKYLNKLYRGNEYYYQRFKYYPDIINCDKIDDIPIDYTGYIAVPITILDWSDKYYEIYRCSYPSTKKRYNDGNFIDAELLENGRKIYKRIIIKMKYAEIYKQMADKYNEAKEASDGLWIDNGCWIDMIKEDYDWVKKHPNGDNTHKVTYN